MVIRLGFLKISGRKVWCHAESDDEKELRRMAERLRVPVREDSRGKHLDLNERKRLLAMRYGAIEKKN